VTAVAATLPTVPFLATLIGLLLPLRARRVAASLAIAAAAVTLLAAITLAVGLRAPVEAATTVARFGSIPVTFGVRVDPAAALVAIAVGAVALAVQVYSVAYLRDDERYVPYAAQVSLFTAAMFLVVVSSDLIELLMGWEVMGICSYLLIGHDRRLPEAPAAAVKAFLVTRVGDVGFLLGIALLGIRTGSFRIADVLSADLSRGTVTAACLLLLAGVAGKSAQFPLHTWLPDAMAGPTPISALIHAATMVAAGIYLVARLYPVFLLAPTTLAVMAVIACVTMLGAALAALAQDDIKRVLAYSTVSQLAYMLGALAVGSATAATFHLLTHAAFKALLFLAAGSVIHAVGSNMMRDMGGLRRAMPITFVTMTVGLAALAGLPPFAGFFSKEAVLGAAEDAARHDGPVAAWAAWLVLVVGLLTVGVTAAYVARLWLMTFFDAPRGRVATHESPPAMRWPLVVLALPAALIGFVGLRDDWLSRWLNINQARPGAFRSLHGEPPPNPLHIGALTSTLSLLLAVAGFVVVLVVWRRAPAVDPSLRLVRLRPALVNAFYVDDLYDRLFVRPVRLAASSVRWTDDEVIVTTVAGSGLGATRLAVLLRRTQQGNVQTYLTGLLAGVVILAVGVVTLT
jgi:NADH-quinone oxidoreductase subunit L